MSVLGRFFRFVEITTKAISVLAFLTGAAYCLHRFGSIDIRSTALFFIAMVLFDMTTTAINNYIDKRASGQTPHFSKGVSLFIIFLMFFTSMALGIYLTVQCGIVVLLLGMLCFAVGIFYTFGPAPISRTPYGEAASGLVMGYCIPFLAIYIGAPQGSFLEINLTALPLASVSMNIYEIIFVLLVSTPLALTIANIMLANNICDVEKDVTINRYTLPYHIGNENALRLFAGLYYAAFAVMGLVSIAGIVPIWCLLSLITLIPVSRNIRAFKLKQIKSETFTLSVMNFLLINAGFAVLIMLGAGIRHFF